MSQYDPNNTDPSAWPNTVRPGDPIPPDSVIGNSELWQGQTPPPKKQRWNRKTAGAAGLLVGLLVGAIAAAGGSSNSATEAASAAGKTVTIPGATVTLPPVVKTVTRPGPTVKVTVTQKPAEAAATIDEGTWEVGVDVAPGRYKTTEAVDPDGMCYWKITTTGSPDHIVDNDIVSGGKPTVTIKKGQDFTTQDCGTWKKVG